MDDLKIIRKHYGEKMMHLCRELFPSLLETPGVLGNLMLEHFEPSKFLYDDIINERMVEEFKNFIYTFIDVAKEITDFSRINCLIEAENVASIGLIEKLGFSYLEDMELDGKPMKRYVIKCCILSENKI